MELFALGASREVGRSAFLLQGDRTTLLLDYGIKVFTARGKPEYPLPLPKMPDAAIITHAHLDHSGYVPNIFDEDKVKWYATPPTVDISEILWNDTYKLAKLNGYDYPFKKTSIERAIDYWAPVVYNQRLRVGEFSLKFIDAGHIAGSFMVRIETKKKDILYTGDFKFEETQMHKGAKPPGEVDILIIESTYWNREHPNRKELEVLLMEEIEETIDNGGIALLPSFALGRTQEMIAVIREYNKDIPVFVDGMGKAITKIYLKYPGYVKDYRKFEKAVESVKIVEDNRDRKKATKQPGVIISTAGMLEGGPALRYIQNLPPNSKIILTGYSVEGTNGWRLLNEGKIVIDEYELKVDLPVEYLDFSAHAGRSELWRMIKETNPELIICVHGDEPEKFAEEIKEKEGIDAVAPKPGEIVKLD